MSITVIVFDFQFSLLFFSGWFIGIGIGMLLSYSLSLFYGCDFSQTRTFKNTKLNIDSLNQEFMSKLAVHNGTQTNKNTKKVASSTSVSNNTDFQGGGGLKTWSNSILW